jgi:hypothetical protein
MLVKTTTNKTTAALSIKLEPEIKRKLIENSVQRGMDLTKLSRAILTNWVEPGRYQI